MTEEQMVWIPVETARNFIRDVFIACKVPEDDAAICADVLISSDTRGIESHGLSRLKMYCDRIKSGIQNPVTHVETVRESPTTAVLDGHSGMGQVIGVKAMQLAMDKARQYGMGSVAVRNSTHFGIAGYYPLMAVRQDMIGLACTNTRPSIAPTFGVQPMLGTNPIAFGAPTDEECPFLFDAATSIIQRGKVEVLSRKQKPVTPGWVIDETGAPAVNADEILKGLSEDTHALLPLGGFGEEFSGHKGYGLATIVEIMSASLQSGYYLHQLTGFNDNGKRRPFCIGHYIMAMRIDAFVDPVDFKHTTGNIIRELRHSKLTSGQSRIFTAGEKEFENEKRSRQTGVPILPSLQKELSALQKEFKLDQYQFPFN
jgi:LDH2 family malate/lactate/ureidoglycolate dehydrogenase